MNEIKDTIIIGSGPSGIQAGVTLKKANKDVIILTTHQSALRKAKEIDNYYGFSKISGEELYQKGITQAKDMGIEIIEEEVIDIQKEKYFIIKTNKNTYQTESAIIAFGIKRNRPNIKGLKEFENKGVSYCAHCEGSLYKDREVNDNKSVIVIGEGEYAAEEAKYLSNIVKDLTIATNGKELINKDELNIKIITTPIKEISGNRRVEKIIFEDNNEIKADGIFIAIGAAGIKEFSNKTGLITKDNYLVVDEKYQTYHEGLFAVGDAIGEPLQITKAVNDGNKAALETIKYINKKKEK